MPIDAKFTADFSQFTTATKGAPSELDKLITKTDNTAKSIAKMSDAAAGRFSVTTAEMKKAGFATQDWTKEIGKFDGALAAAGVNISSQTRAFGELQAAAGKTVSQFGALASAGAAVAVAMAAWEFGRWIAGVLDLDTKIANLNGSLDALKAQEKGAGLDVLANASRIAGREITNMTEALQIVNKSHADHQLAAGASANAAGEAGKAYAQMYKELGVVRARGDLPELKRQLENYDFSLQTLSTRFGVHIETLELYRKNIKAAADQEKERAKSLEESKKALDKLIQADWAGVLKGQTTELLVQNPALQQSIDLLNTRVQAEWAAKEALAARMGFDKAGNRLAEAGSVEGITAAYEKEKAALVAVGASVAELDLLYLNYQDTILQTGGTIKQTGDQTAVAGNQAQQAAGQYAALGQAATYVAGSFQNLWTQVGHAPGYEQSLRTMNDMLSEYARAGVPVSGGLIPGAGHRAAGGPVASGSAYWVGERGPELFVPKTSGSIVPAGAAGGVTVNVYGSVLSTQRELATLVEDAMMRTYRQGGNRQPV
jgi:hypothetical protein